MYTSSCLAFKKWRFGLTKDMEKLSLIFNVQKHDCRKY